MATHAPLQRRVDAYRSRRQDRDGDLGKPAPRDQIGAQPRERRALGSVEAHRRDERLAFLGDQGGAVVNLHQRARDGDPPLGEDHQTLAAPDLVDERARRQRPRGIERTRVGEPQERLHPPATRDAHVDREDRRRVEQRQDDRRVEERDVVERDDVAHAFLRQVFGAHDLEPEQQLPDDPQHEAEDIGGQAAEEVDRRDEIGDSQPDQRRRFVDAGQFQQQGDRQRADDHIDRVQRVDGADDARAVILARPGLHRGEDRHHEKAGGAGIDQDLDRDAQPHRAFEKFQQPDFRARWRHRPRGEAEVDADRAHDDQHERCRRQLNAAVRKRGGRKRADGYADREQQIDRGLDLDAAADARFDDDGHQRKRDRPDHPEPTDRDRADPLAIVGLQLAQDVAGRGPRIEIDLEVGRADAGGGDPARRRVAGERHRSQLKHDGPGRAALGGGVAAEHEAADDRREGRALDERVAGDQLFLFQVIGQDTVFDRPEQSRDAAEAEQSGIKQRQRREPESRRRDQLHPDFNEFQPPCDQRLVVRVGDFAAERRERDRGQHEDGNGERHLGSGVGRAEPEQDHQRQHLAHEIIVERREELAPKKRREAPRAHELAEHGPPTRSQEFAPEWEAETETASSCRFAAQFTM